MECKDETWVTGYRIWQHEVEWREHKTMRLGYLFFGAPNERSTAAPPRDFYLFFIQPLKPPQFKDDRKPDEVLFRLTGTDEAWERGLRMYAAATALVVTSSGAAQDAYQKRADEYLAKVLVKWLQEHIFTAITVTYQGKTKPLADWIKGGGGQPRGVRDLINSVASACLAGHFTDTAPEYPSFSVLLTKDSRGQAAQDALRAIAGSQRTKQATAVLDGLELLDGDRLDPHRSRYAQQVLKLLNDKPHGQVLNRTELIQEDHDVEYFAPERLRLEPELLVVVLAALVYSGDVVLSLPGKDIDAAGLASLAASALADLVAFKHVKPPKEWNLPALRALFELVALPPGNAQAVTQNDELPVQQLITKVQELLARLVATLQRTQNPPAFWGRAVMTPAEVEQLVSQLATLKTFLESLQPYTTPGKLKNFKYTTEEVSAQRKGTSALAGFEKLQSLLSELEPFGTYMAVAETVLSADHPWRDEAHKTHDAVVQLLEDPKTRSTQQARQFALNELATLKRSYSEAYLALHGKARLGPKDDKRKGKLVKDPRLATLKSLATIELMPSAQLAALQQRLAALQTCISLTPDDLHAAPVCPHCSFRPAPGDGDLAAAAVLSAIDGELDDMLQKWTKALLDNLEDPTTRSQLELLGPDQVALVGSFLASRTLPDPLPQEFVYSVREALSGLTKVVVRTEVLRAALAAGGAPATLPVLRERFEEHLAGLTKGKDPSKVRLVIE